MKILVDAGRFLSVPCDSEEYLVFDREERKYHLLRESAARLWDQIQAGGHFDLEGVEEAADPVALLSEFGLITLMEGESGSALPLPWKRSSTSPGFST